MQEDKICFDENMVCRPIPSSFAEIIVRVVHMFLLVPLALLVWALMILIIDTVNGWFGSPSLHMLEYILKSIFG